MVSTCPPNSAALSTCISSTRSMDSLPSMSNSRQQKYASPSESGQAYQQSIINVSASQAYHHPRSGFHSIRGQDTTEPALDTVGKPLNTVRIPPLLRLKASGLTEQRPCGGANMAMVRTNSRKLTSSSLF